MKKNLLQLGFKPVAVQDECFTDQKEGLIVLVKYEKQGKRNMIVKYDALSFPDVNYLDKWMEENGIQEATPATEFKAPRNEQALHLIKSL